MSERDGRTNGSFPLRLDIFRPLLGVKIELRLKPIRTQVNDVGGG